MTDLVTVSREYKPHSTLMNAAYCILEHAKENRDGRTLFIMASLTMEAFALEGYVNLIGPRLYKDKWDERSFGGTKDKIKAVLKKADPEADFGGQPYQIIHDLLKFRDDMAHPKNIDYKQTLSKAQIEQNEQSYSQWLPTFVESFATMDNANAIAQALDDIYKRTWKDEWPEGSPFMGGGSMMT